MSWAAGKLTRKWQRRQKRLNFVVWAVPFDWLRTRNGAMICPSWSTGQLLFSLTRIEQVGKGASGIQRDLLEKEQVGKGGKRQVVGQHLVTPSAPPLWLIFITLRAIETDLSGGALCPASQRLKMLRLPPSLLVLY